METKVLLPTKQNVYCINLFFLEYGGLTFKFLNGPNYLKHETYLINTYT